MPSPSAIRLRTTKAQPPTGDPPYRPRCAPRPSWTAPRTETSRGWRRSSAASPRVVRSTWGCRPRPARHSSRRPPPSLPAAHRGLRSASPVTAEAWRRRGGAQRPEESRRGAQRAPAVGGCEARRRIVRPGIRRCLESGDTCSRRTSSSVATSSAAPATEMPPRSSSSAALLPRCPRPSRATAGGSDMGATAGRRQAPCEARRSASSRDGGGEKGPTHRTVLRRLGPTPRECFVGPSTRSLSEGEARSIARSPGLKKEHDCARYRRP